MLKEFILNKSQSYNFKIVKIRNVNQELLNLIQKNLKNIPSNYKFLGKIKRIEKGQIDNFVFILRCLDFRLWEFPQNWNYKNERGFWGLMERVIDLFNLDLNKITFTEFKQIISPKENLTITKIRFKIFKSALNWLKKYNNNFGNYFEENKKAFDFCINLFELEKYRDFNTNFYFLKPNQLLYLEYLLGKKLIEKFEDELETLTIFADYKIPQFFINLGLIEVPEKYLKKLKEGKVIKRFSLFENEIRLASILLGEEISRKLKIPAYKVDNILWWLSHKIKLKIPKPKVKTIFY